MMVPLTEAQPLGTAARKALSTCVFVASVINSWELVLKARKRGALVEDPLSWWEEYVIAPGIPTLSIHTAHI